MRLALFDLDNTLLTGDHARVVSCAFAYSSNCPDPSVTADDHVACPAIGCESVAGSHARAAPG